MASTTKGSIKISTANGIGAALVDVLGGEGYKPDEWEQNINLCGIHAADIESALENIEEDAGTGAERGSILLSTANAIGATLNKKFNTSRGFSPREWASAASKLEPLPERTASGAIAHIEDGADRVPLKNWLVTLPASLDGYSEVNAVQSGKNLFDKSNPNEIDGYFTTTGFSTGNVNAKTIYIPIKGGTTWTVSKTAGQRFQIATAETIPANNATFTNRQAGNTNTSLTITAGASDKYLWAWVFLEGTDTGTLADMLASIQIEVGSTATAYEAYTAPTQYTATLGRTVYGADVDLVSGQGTETGIRIDLSELTWNMDNDTRFRSRQTDYTGASGWSGNWQNTISNHFVCENPATAFANRSDYSFANIPQNYYNFDIKVPTGIFADATEFKAWLANVDGNGTHAIIVIDRLDSVPFTFDGQEIPSLLGVNNFWADEGDSAVTYRKDLDIPDPVPGNLLGMNNGNNEENEEESEG